MKYLTLTLCICLGVIQLSSQNTENLSPIIFIYDASGSMWGQIEGKTKMEIASHVLNTTVNTLSDAQDVGLVAYGHRKKDDCNDVEFLVDPVNGTRTQITGALELIKPLGKTPLAASASMVIQHLKNTKMRATVILLTDGIESCGGELCKVILTAKNEGIEFRLHIIGFGIKETETEQLKCAATAGEGQYFGAAGAEELSAMLNTATTVTVDKPAATIAVHAVKNGNPIDAHIQSYKAGTREYQASGRTYADTAILYLPAGVYDLEIKPLEGSDVGAITLENVESFKDSLVIRTVSFDAGKIAVTSTNNGEGWDAIVKVYQSGTGTVAARGRTYGKQELYDISPGMYDVEIEALGIEGKGIVYRVENVNVKVNEIININHNFTSGIAMIGATSSTGLVDAVVKIIDTIDHSIAANGRTYTTPNSNPKKFILTLGKYNVQLTGLGDYKGTTRNLTLDVKAGDQVARNATF